MDDIISQLHDEHLEFITKMDFIADKGPQLVVYLTSLDRKHLYTFDDEVALIATLLGNIHDHNSQVKSITMTELNKALENRLPDKLKHLLPKADGKNEDELKEAYITVMWEGQEDIMCSHDRSIIDQCKQSLEVLWNIEPNMFKELYKEYREEINWVHKKRYPLWNFETKCIKL